MTRPRVLAISSCTGAKARVDGGVLSRADFDRGRSYVDERHRGDLAATLVPAEDLYRGQQHRRLMRGVHAAREAGTVDLDLRIVSAGYGLVGAGDRLAPYECTFHGMARTARHEWARVLAIPEKARAALARPSALSVVLLGDEYLDCCGLDETLTLGGPTVVFCGSQAALRVPALPSLSVVRLSTDHTRTFQCGLVGLKGEIGGRLLAYVADDPIRLERLDAEALLKQLASLGQVASIDTQASLALS